MSYLLLSTISGQKIGALSYTDGDTLPNHFANGLPYESDGTLAVSVDGAISHYHQGLPFTASGRLAGTLSETPTRFGGGAAPFSASGHLTLGSSGVTHYSGGICYTESGSIGSAASGPPIIQRYLTQLDGQSKFFRRETVWECVDPVVEVVFLGYEPTTTYMLFDGDLTGNARAFAFINANTGYVNCPNAQTLELNGVAVPPNTSAAKPVEGELNRIRVSFTGSWKVQVLGCRFARDAAFAPTIIESIKLIDSADTANTFNYPLDENLPYELPDGEADPLANSALIFENGSIDGSDRLLVTEKEDGSGFVGETGTEYDYANGAAPPPPLIQRYFTQLDGQSKYWRRVEPDYGQTTTATIECLFYGGGGSGVQYLVGRHSGDRFYLALQNSNLVYGNGTDGGIAPTAVNLSKINSAKLVADGTDVKFYVNGVLIATQAQGWSGLLDEVGFGVKGDQLLDFYSGILVSARVTTNTVDNVYGLDKNLAYELPDGVESLELWDDPASEIESGWVYNGNGGYTRSAAGNDSAIGNNIAFVSGQAVNITLTIDSIDVGGFKVSAQGGASVNVPSTSGVHTVQCIAGASGTTKVSGTTASTRGSVSGVSIKVASALIFENGSVDGSDRLLVTKKEDGTGFVGETGIEYDYATGAAPVDSYGTEYSTAYS